MTIYGRDYYGQDPNGAFVYYGITYPLTTAQSPVPVTTTQVASGYTVDPFLATSIDYGHILLTWQQPVNSSWLDFRLLSNRYGFPVDENDGTILLDSNGSAYPGSTFTDPNVIPGTYHHYGIYLLITETINSPNLLGYSTYSTSWTNGTSASYLAGIDSQILTITPNIPPGAPYPYGVEFQSTNTADGSATFSYPFNNPIPIQPSTVYTATAWVYSPTGYVTLGMNWQNASFISQSTSQNQFSVPTNKWTLVSTAVTSPGSGSSFGSVIISGGNSFDTNQYIMYATGITIQPGTVGSGIASQSQNIWVRAGLAACLAPTNYNSTQFLLDSIPIYYKESPPANELTTFEPTNPLLIQYLSIIAWALDYLKTALSVAQNVNNPDLIPINYLFNLAETVGFPFEPEISAAIIRQGVANVATLVQQRGTPEGIVAYTTSLAGFSLDLQQGYNMMLDDNQSSFPYPQTYGIWQATQVYQINDLVTFGPYVYSSATAGNINNSPTGLNTSNSNWTVIYYLQIANSGGYITNANTLWPSTYEPRWLNETNDYPNDVTALRQSIGVQNRTNNQTFLKNVLRMKNNSGSSCTIDIRSVSRLPADITLGNAQPDAIQVIGDGVPVPFTIPQQVWSATTTYSTGQIVTYNGIPFIALKASTNSTPSSNYTPTNEWQPIGYDGRVQLMSSAYVTTDTGGTTQYYMQPYVSFYDQSGLHIADLFPRVNTTGGQLTDVQCCASTNQAFAHTSNTILTASANGITTIDGFVITTIGQNVLLTGQTSALDNGYYSVTTVGTVSVKTVLTRYSTTASAYPGSYTYCQNGTANGGTTNYCTNVSTPTLGTTALTFSTTTPNQSILGGSLLFDSFAKPSDWGSNVTAHSPEVGQVFGSYSYTAQSNNFAINAFNNGVVTPTNLSGQCLVTTNYSLANAMIGITIVTTPTNAGYIMGLAGRVSGASSYIRIDQNGITTNNAGTFTQLAAHSVAAQAGDRLTALFNGNVITVYINGTQVSTATTAFNNTQTNFGYIYEPFSTLFGKVQPRTTMTWSRRPAKRGRSFSFSIKGSAKSGGSGTVQPRVTIPVPRRKATRAAVYFKAVTTTNLNGGRTQPRVTLANQRNAQQRTRAYLRFVHVVTTDLLTGSVQPDSTVMLPRRRSTRAYVRGTTPTYSYRLLGSVQSRATLANQRSYLQRHRAVVGGDMFQGDGIFAPGKFGPSGITQRLIPVAQRKATQRSRASVQHRGIGQAYGQSGNTQRIGVVVQRSIHQHSRGITGNNLSLGDGQGSTIDRINGVIQPRTTVQIPRRKSTRAKIGSISQVELGHGPLGTASTQGKIVQRLASQRSRVVSLLRHGQVADIIGGQTQPRTAQPSQRDPRKRSRIVFAHVGKTADLLTGTVQPRATIIARRRTARAVVGGRYGNASHGFSGQEQPLTTMTPARRRPRGRAVKHG